MLRRKGQWIEGWPLAGVSRRGISIAVGLSGGVDSSVTALLVRHLLRGHCDVAALRSGVSRHAHVGVVAHRDKGLAAVVASRAAKGLSLPPWSAEDLTMILKDAIEGEADRSPQQAQEGNHHHDHHYNQQQQVVGYFMRNWRPEDHHQAAPSLSSTSSTSSSLYCTPSDADYEDALYVATHPILSAANGNGTLQQQATGLDAFRVVDFSTDYYHRVFCPMLEAFFRGRTVNPDVYCNSEVKFKSLLQHARRLAVPPATPKEEQGAVHDCLLPPDGRCDFIATGHYARTLVVDGGNNSSSSVLLATPLESYQKVGIKGTDGGQKKGEGNAAALNDQTHYLSRLCRTTQLPYALFPLGALLKTKRDVRDVATYFFGDRIGNRTTSTGLCFVAEHLPQPSKPTTGRASVVAPPRGVSPPSPPNIADAALLPSRRAVSPQSSFRDLLAREYTARHGGGGDDGSSGGGGPSVIHQRLCNVQFTLVADATHVEDDAAAAAIADLPHTHLVIADADHCYPFDFPNGKKVMCRGLRSLLPPRADGGGKKKASAHAASPNPSAMNLSPKEQRTAKELTKLYVCGRALTGEDGDTPQLSRVYLSRSPNHPMLQCARFAVSKDIHWLVDPSSVLLVRRGGCGATAAEDPSSNSISNADDSANATTTSSSKSVRCLVSCRHHDPPSPCELRVDSGEVVLLDGCRKFNVTGGQTAVFYREVPCGGEGVGGAQSNMNMIVVAASTIL